MGLYGNDLFVYMETGEVPDKDYNYVEEGAMFLSSEGKSLKKEIKEICKKYKSDGSFKEKIKNNFKYKYDSDMANKVFKDVEKLFDKVSISDVIEIISKDSYGATYTDYKKHICGVSGNIVFQCDIFMRANKCVPVYFSDFTFDKCIIPKEVVEYAISNDPGFGINISKNRISFASIDETKYIKGKEGKTDSFCNKIIKFTEKFSDKVSVSKGMISDLKFKKKK